MKEGVDDDIIDINSNSIILKRIEEKELIDMVYNFKYKKSTDCKDIAISKKYIVQRKATDSYL